MKSLPDISELPAITAAAQGAVEAVLRQRARLGNRQGEKVHNVQNLKFAIATIMGVVKSDYGQLKTVDDLVEHLSVGYKDMMYSLDQSQAKDVAANPGDRENLEQHYRARKAETGIVYESIATAFGLLRQWQKRRSEPVADAGAAR
jgi:hypothetical protein